MVRLDLARTANTNLFSNHPLVAVFVGGTSGIGEYTLRSLADLASTQNQGTGLRVYLVGRNATAADTILDDCRKKCPQARFFFVKASNIAELSDVDKCCAEIKRLEEQTSEGSGPARVDLLAMSQAVLQFGPRNGTSPV
jgi:NAD(P)-dependent dehydrogenase (short-subunit alcohol dehydrogenase family)